MGTSVEHPPQHKPVVRQPECRATKELLKYSEMSVVDTSLKPDTGEPRRKLADNLMLSVSPVYVHQSVADF